MAAGRAAAVADVSGKLEERVAAIGPYSLQRFEPIGEPAVPQ